MEVEHIVVRDGFAGRPLIELLGQRPFDTLHAGCGQDVDDLVISILDLGHAADGTAEEVGPFPTVIADANCQISAAKLDISTV